MFQYLRVLVFRNWPDINPMVFSCGSVTPGTQKYQIR